MCDQFGPGAVGVGWDLTLLGLASHLAGVERGEASQLAQGPAMRAFMIASSEEWGAALQVSGADPGTVARTVAATAAFYAPPIE